jgi:hypothetical protein
MTGNTQHIIKQLFRESSLDDIQVAQLEELVQSYPYFGAGHYLLSKKLQHVNNNSAFLQQTEKTALYFENPLWLQWLLKNGDEKKQLDMDSVFFNSQQAALDILSGPVLESQPIVSEAPIPVEIQEPIEKVSAPSDNELPLFEPFHTVDYFASQGIKFVQDTNPNDKLGKHLKSFTEWLKTMKKLPQQTAAVANTDETIDPAIAASAAHSIEEKEVVTEAMAEVLVKQGKMDNAAALYGKLSLLYPDKSAYFAAKIEQLKVH